MHCGLSTSNSLSFFCDSYENIPWCLRQTRLEKAHKLILTSNSSSVCTLRCLLPPHTINQPYPPFRLFSIDLMVHIGTFGGKTRSVSRLYALFYNTTSFDTIQERIMILHSYFSNACLSGLDLGCLPVDQISVLVSPAYLKFRLTRKPTVASANSAN
jgi:hypothetical protein